MIPLPENIQQALNNLPRPPIYAKVLLVFAGAIENPTIITSEAISNCNPSQIANFKANMDYKVFSLDGNCVLDSSHTTMSKSSDVETGFWSKDVSDKYGLFVNPPEVKAEFEPISMTKFRLIGDIKRYEYPIDFTVSIQFSDGTSNEFTVTNNDSVEWNYTIAEDATKLTKSISYTITKWSKPFTNAKISDILYTLSKEYTNDDVMNVGLREDVKYARSNDALDSASASSNEVDIQVRTVNNELDPLNKASIYAGLLEKNRLVALSLGYNLDDIEEYIPYGLYRLDSFSAVKDNPIVHLVANDKLRLMAERYYESSKVFESTIEQPISLSFIAKDIFTSYGLTENQYKIDPYLDTIQMRYGWLERMTYKDALKKIADVCLGVVYCDRLGVINIYVPSVGKETRGVYKLNTDILMSNKPVKDTTSIINRINVPYTEFKETQEEVYSSTTDIITANTGKLIDIPFPSLPYIDKEPVIDITDIIPAEAIITKTFEKTGQGRGTVTLSSNIPVTKCTVKVTRTKVVEGSVTNYVKSAQQSSIGIVEKNLEPNRFIQHIVIADSIASTILATYKDGFILSEITIPANPALEQFDTVEMAVYGTDVIKFQIVEIFTKTTEGSIVQDLKLRANIT